MAIGTSVTPSSPLNLKTDMNTCLQITIPGDGKFSLVCPPQHGNVSISITSTSSPANIVTYTPNTGFTGEDSFTYKTTDRQGTDSSIAKVVITVRAVRVPKSVHVLWVLVSISLLAALYFAYLDTTSNSTLDMLLPKTNVTINTLNMNTTANTTVIRTSHTNTLSVPQIPRFIIIWGYIGAAAYLLKVVTGYLGAREYQSSFLPFHISRLFIGPALGYFVRSVIETLSNIINAIFNIKESKPS